MAIDTSGDVTGTPNTSARLVVGDTASGSLTITAGDDVVTEVGAVVGGAAEAVGTVRVSDVGSSWTVGGGNGPGESLTVGLSGTGTLIVENGATVSVLDNIPASAGDFQDAIALIGRTGNGTVEVRSGGTFLIEDRSADGGLDGFTIGGDAAAAGGSGSLSVQGANSLARVAGNALFGSVGTNGGEGSLTVANGARMEMEASAGDVELRIGQSGGNGQATISGGTLTLETTAAGGLVEIEIGRGGAGSLRVDNGGSVILDGSQATQAAILLSSAGGTSNLSIDGPGSSVEVIAGSTAGVIIVGRSAPSTVSITNGGSLELNIGTSTGPARFISIGTTDPSAAQGTGTVTVNGTGSQLLVDGAGSILVGNSGTGTLNVENNGTVTSQHLAIGMSAQGSVNVTTGGAVQLEGVGDGTGPSLSIGRFDDGSLNVVNGTVTLDGTADPGGSGARGSISLGESADGEGIVNLEGANARFTILGDGVKTSIGLEGTGRLNVTAGAQVVNQGAGISVMGEFAGSSGFATIDGASSLWDAGAVLVVGGAYDAATGSPVAGRGEGTLALRNGATVRADEIHLLDAMVTGNGTLAGDVTVQGGTINPGTSAGLIAVDGDFAIAAGILNIEVGGTAASAFDRIVVNGDASLGGTLNVSLIDGFLPALGDTFDVLVADSIAQSFATANLASIAEGRSFSLSVVDLANGDQALRLTVTSGSGGGTGDAEVTGNVVGTPNVSPFLIIGDTGSGSLTIAGGDTVVSGEGAVLGRQSTGLGSVVVQDFGSRWTVGGGDGQARFLTVGEAGSGRLTIRGGAEVHVLDNASAGPGQDAIVFVGRSGSGRLEIENGGRLLIQDDSGDGGADGLWIGGDSGASGGTGRVTVGGFGSSISIAGNGAFVNVGTNNGRGELTVANGGTLLLDGNTGAATLIAGQSGGFGQIQVSDAVLTLGSDAGQSASSFIHLGESGGGTGSLTITDGGNVTLEGRDGANPHVTLGVASGTRGQITVDGFGSQLNVRGAGSEIVVGAAGEGTLNVMNSGMVRGLDLTLGQHNAGAGTVNLISGGSMNLTGLTSDGDGPSLVVGQAGRGTLNIEAGSLNVLGQGARGSLVLGEASGSEGVVNLTNGAARLTVGGDNGGVTIIGQGGTGRLNILDSGQVRSPDGGISIVAKESGSQGFVTVDGGGSRWDAGTSLYVGLNVNPANGIVTGQGGNAVLTVTNNGTIEADTIQIGNGLVTGVGTLGGNVVNQGGIIAPGANLGQLTVTGDLGLQSGQVDLELSGLDARNFDRIVVNGDVGLGGTLNVTLTNGYIPALGDSFDVVVADGISGRFATVNLPTMPFPDQYFRWDIVNYSNGDQALRLSVTDTPPGPGGGGGVPGGPGTPPGGGFVGTPGTDRFPGSPNDDTIIASGGNDFYNGGGGRNTLDYSGAPGPIHANLNSGIINDGFGSIDTVINFQNVIGSEHDDILRGNDADNRLEGGGGKDFLVGSLGNDTLDGGEGNDTVSYAGGAAVRIDLAISTAFNTIGSGRDTILNVENVIGSNFNDNLAGDAGNNTLIGNAGHDTLSGREGDDYLYGGEGNDLLLGGSGDDFLYGGPGDDTLDGGAGRDTAVYDGADGVHVRLWLSGPQGTVGAGHDTLIGIENVIGTNANDHIVGNASDNYLTGRDGADTLTGREGNDILDGGAGNDSLTGGDGDDYLIGGPGNDTVDGGAGNDTASYEGSAAVRVDLGVAGPQNTIGAGIDTLISIENLIGGSGSDTLTGDDGDNLLIGGAGDDILTGGGGNDTLTGGAGSDIFVLAGGGGTNVITDFADGTDLIDFRGAGLTFADLTITQVGANALLDYDSGTATLNGVSAGLLSTDDFLF